MKIISNLEEYEIETTDITALEVKSFNNDFIVVLKIERLEWDRVFDFKIEIKNLDIDPDFFTEQGYLKTNYKNDFKTRFFNYLIELLQDCNVKTINLNSVAEFINEMIHNAYAF